MKKCPFCDYDFPEESNLLEKFFTTVGCWIELRRIAKKKENDL